MISGNEVAGTDLEVWSPMEHTTTRRFFPRFSPTTIGTLLLVLSVGPLAGFAKASHEVSVETPTEDAPFAEEMATAETSFRTTGRSRSRAHNVELAAKFLHGAVLQPGETLSFNQRVGERSAENGFLAAPVIAAGRIRSGMGGGVCQVSTTLHIASLGAGLEIVEHRTHSRPSSYAPVGLDAPAPWGALHYQVRNPYDYPVRVSAFTRGGEVHVSIEGAEVVAHQVSGETVRELPIRERVVTDASLAAGAREVEQAGRVGAVARVVVVAADGTRQVENHWYSAAPRIVRIGA